MQASNTKKKAVKPAVAEAKSERQMTAGHQAIKFSPADLTVVTKKHPLAEKLYLTRNDTVYEKGSAKVEAFKEQGQLQPIGLFPYKNPVSGEQELVVAFGVQRRNMALAAGIPVEGVIFKDWTPADAEAAMIVENEQRINLSFKDQLMAIRRLVKYHREAKTPKYFDLVARLFGKGSHQWARDMYAVSGLPKEVLAKVPDVIPFATAIQIARSEPTEGSEQTIEQAQLAAFREVMDDETNITQKGKKSVDKALSNRVGKAPVEKLSSAELRVIIANEDVDLSLDDESVRILIAGIIGDKDVKEVQRAGIEWYTHVEVAKAKTGKAAKNARKEAARKENQVKIEDLEFDDDDDDEVSEDEDE
jgi:hypothetical protein